MHRAFLQSRDGNTVIFYHSPKIRESRTSNYESPSIPNATMQAIYTTTDARRISISCPFISRTDEEARYTKGVIDTIRRWSIPASGFYDFASTKHITLKAFGSVFDNVPLVLNTYDIDFDNDVDYIYVDGSQIPIVLNLSLDMTESLTSQKLEQFSPEAVNAIEDLRDTFSDLGDIASRFGGFGGNG